MKTLRITTHWTTEQAEDVYMLFDDLKLAIWEIYGDDIVTMHREIAFEEKKRIEMEDDGQLKNEPLF